MIVVKPEERGEAFREIQNAHKLNNNGQNRVTGKDGLTELIVHKLNMPQLIRSLLLFVIRDEIKKEYKK